MEEGRWGVIVVDVQGDFTTCKGGPLAVPDSDEEYVVEVEKATRRLKEGGFVIIGTQDWHPADHVSFFSNHQGMKPYETISIGGRMQTLWPPHCIQGSPGADIVVDKALFDAVIRKGLHKDFDSYSGFEDDRGVKTGLDEVLRELGVGRILVFGIATDYCVRATAIHGIDYGYRVVVVEGLCRGVAPDTTEAALREMEERGVVVVREIKNAPIPLEVS